MAALTLKAGTSLCRRCCRDPFLGEVLAGCPERLQLGGNEHASPRDVVRAPFSVEVGGRSVLPPASTHSYPVEMVFAGITPDVAWKTIATRPASERTGLNNALREMPELLLCGPIISIAPCLPPVASALVASQNWVLAGQDSHM